MRQGCSHTRASVCNVTPILRRYGVCVYPVQHYFQVFSRHLEELHSKVKSGFIQPHLPLQHAEGHVSAEHCALVPYRYRDCEEVILDRGSEG
jgi:hypothetical protein